MKLLSKLLDGFSVHLLDMNGTFMFGQDRFGPDEDFHATYRALGGTALGSDQVRESIRGCHEGMLNFCKSPQNFSHNCAGIHRLCEGALLAGTPSLLWEGCEAHVVHRFLRRQGVETHQLKALVISVFPSHSFLSPMGFGEETDGTAGGK